MAAIHHGIADNTEDQLKRGEAFLAEAEEAAAMAQIELPTRSDAENAELLNDLQELFDRRC